jgi:glutamate/aspartate transport system permease protein
VNLDFSFFSWEVASSFVRSGLLFSLQLCLIAMLGGMALGTVLALLRLSSRPWLSMPAAAYINTMRSIPLVMVILWFFLLVPAVFYDAMPGGWASDHRPEFSAILTFTLFEAAYFAEIMRAGIQSIPKGQTHAGYAIGMSYRQIMQFIVLPQALRNMLPVLLTQTIILFQDTSLVYAIGAYDLLKGFETAGRNFNRPVETYLVAAALYFAICFGLSMLVRRLQKKIAIIR